MLRLILFKIYQILNNKAGYRRILHLFYFVGLHSLHIPIQLFLQFFVLKGICNDFF